MEKFYPSFFLQELGFFFALPRARTNPPGFLAEFDIKGGIMSKRVGFVGIIIEDRKKAAHMVNDLLSEFGDIIIARVGLPYRERHCSVIT